MNLEHIKYAVCEEFGISPALLRSSSRQRHIARPRQVAMYAARKLTDASLRRCANYFGLDDHTTALVGVRRVAQLCSESPDFAVQVESTLARARAFDALFSHRLEAGDALVHDRAKSAQTTGGMLAD